MRFTVHYIPLNQISPDREPSGFTKRLKRLRNEAMDCMHILIVRRNRKGGGYTLVSGSSQYTYWKSHTKKLAVPCLVDESKSSSAVNSVSSWLKQWRRSKLAPNDTLAQIKPGKRSAQARSILRTFLKQEPRFQRLTRTQQLKVLLLGLRYKKTVLQAMKAKVDEWA